MQKLPFDILFENDDIIAINKPSGMLTLPDRHDGALQSVRGILEARFGEIFVVHRLDKDTSGVMVFAKNDTTHRYLSQLFEGRTIEKIYCGIVYGTPVPDQGMIDEPIAEHPAKNGTMMIHHKGKASQTEYKVVHTLGKLSLVQYQLHTGRTHQIRVHSKFIGHPIVCDPVYGDGKPILLSAYKKKYHLSKNELEERPILSRLALHAQSIRFNDQQGDEIFIEAPMPNEFKALVNQLSK